jgi:predicted GNAT family N-acyltransferase
MDLSSLSFIRLTEEYAIKPFDCGDSDLNDFLLNDSRNYLKELLAVTYIIEDPQETIAFLSLLNDKITIRDVDNNNFWNRLRKKLPQRKRFTSYPAVKIARLGVSNNYKGAGYGKTILDYLKILFTTNNRTGCKYITVDAYKQSLKFYEKNGFNYLTEKDIEADTRLMYFDLALIKQ